MHKIYSRPRIKLPKCFFRRRHLNRGLLNKEMMINKRMLKSPRNPKVEKLSKIILILVIAFMTAKTILDAILPIFDNLCENKAESMATIISNEQATNVMKDHSYDEIFTIEKDSNGNITMIKSNIIPINEIASDIANKIQNEINSQGREDISIALGSFTGFKLLAGRGPGVKIRISSIGNVETDLKSEFSSKGINQTLHRVYLQVNCEMSILTPFDNITRNITNQVLLMENIIVGNIPDTYYNLEGLNSGDAMEVME